MNETDVIVVDFPNDFYDEIVTKNFDKPDEILKILAQNNEPYHKHVILFNLPEMLKS